MSSISNVLRIGDYETELINEISAISTHKAATVRSILESTHLRQIESLLSSEDNQNYYMDIPYIGTVHIIYNGDNYVSGAKISDITCYLEPSDLLKRLIGEIHDGESNIIWKISEKKITSALQQKLEE